MIYFIVRLVFISTLVSLNRNFRLHLPPACKPGICIVNVRLYRAIVQFALVRSYRWTDVLGILATTESFDYAWWWTFERPCSEWSDVFRVGVTDLILRC